MNERLAIVLVTYERTELAVRTVQALSQNLDYPKELRSWYVADDGSRPFHMHQIFKALEDNGESLFGSHYERIRPIGMQDTYFCGKGWNRALNRANDYSDYVLIMEDDWELRKPLSIQPYLTMLSERQDVGMVRLGHLAVGSDVHIVGHNGVHYLKYQRSTQYAYSGNPHIRHKRFLEYYGYFSEEKNPGEIELDYDARFRAGVGGPDIWRPADIPGWGVFGHTGTEKSFA